MSGFEQLRALGSAERAQATKRYLGSELEFLGARVGEVRAQVRLLDAPSLSLASELWREPVHEFRLAAVIVLERCAPALRERDLPELLRFVRESRTWAYVDPLACNVLGAMRMDHAQMDAWARDEDFWVRRAALLSQLRLLRAGGDFARFGAYADSMLHEREFFIRKAIGWVLRETAKKRPGEVFDWLAPRASRTSAVTMREALKYLSEEQRRVLRP